MANPNSQPDAYRPGLGLRTYGDVAALGALAHHFASTETSLTRTDPAESALWTIPGTDMRVPAEVAVEVSKAIRSAQ